MNYDAKFLERFWSKVDKSKSCWEWTASTTGPGYGQIRYRTWETNRLAHRVSFEIAHGPIPNGKLIRHKCDNRRCINPDHLIAGTQKENIADMWERGRANPRPLRGAENGNSVSADVDKIKELYRSGWRVRDIAPLFGIGKSTVSNIVRNQHWMTRDV